jgi:hypothetical protein
MREKPKRYLGELATPITWPSPPMFEGYITHERVEAFWLDYDRHQQEAEQLVQEVRLRKLSLLMSDYGIEDQNDTLQLAMMLACDHVPGFRVVPERKKTQGRKKEWDAEKLEALLDAVKSVKKQHRFNDRQALAFLSNNARTAAEWGPPRHYKGTKKQWIETLESRLQDAKRWVAWVKSVLERAETIRQQVLQEKFRK